MKAFCTLALLPILMLSSCMIPPRYKLSRFSYNNKNRNSLIVNRRPDYGDGHKDGCIIMGEIDLKARTLPKDTVIFEVRDVNNNQPLNAKIEIFYKGVNDGIALPTDSFGLASIKIKFDIERLKVTSLAYRGVIIDLKQFKGL